MNGKLSPELRTAIKDFKSPTGQKLGRKIRLVAEIFNVSTDYLLGLSDDNNDHTNMFRLMPDELSRNDEIYENEIKMIAKYFGVTSDFLLKNNSHASSNQTPNLNQTNPKFLRYNLNVTGLNEDQIKRIRVHVKEYFAYLKQRINHNNI